MGAGMAEAYIYLFFRAHPDSCQLELITTLRDPVELTIS